MPTFNERADTKLQALAAKQAEFTSLTCGQKALLLTELEEALRAAQADLPGLGDSAALAQGCSSASGKDADMPWIFEQLLTADWVAGFCAKYKTTLETFAKTGSCPEALKVRQRSDGQYVADVFPASDDKMKPSKNWKCELRIQKGKQPTQGATLTKKRRDDSVGLVLGAGNVSALAVSDCLHLLFQQNTVVLYKVHPVRGYHEAFARKLFAPLIAKGYFETIVEENGLADAQYLVAHPKLCHIHMTGSTETHDSIVWGPKQGREERRAKNTPVIDLSKVEVTSELGCVTPYMVCPGTWKEEELKHHALHLAVSCTGNNGYYCNSPKVLVLAEDWPQKEAFLAILKAIMKDLPHVAPYYPGTHRRYQAFEAAYGSNLIKIEGPNFGKSEKHGDHVPWTLNPVSVDPTNLEASKDEYAFRNEPFCPILTVASIKGVSEPAEYLQAATTLANKCIWGRLSCSLVVHPSTQQSAAAAVDKAIADLEYGAVVINCWSAMSYSFTHGAWGAYAGGEPPLETIDNVESGLGFVQNALAFDHVEKAVSTCPFIDKDSQVGTGEMMDRDKASAVINLVINPGMKALLKLIFPRMFACL